MDYLRDKGYVFKVVSANRGGVPDLVCCIKGRFVAFEVKVGRNGATELQRINIEQIVKNGGEAYVVRSLDEVKNILECITNGVADGKQRG